MPQQSADMTEDHPVQVQQHPNLLRSGATHTGMPLSQSTDLIHES